VTTTAMRPSERRSHRRHTLVLAAIVIGASTLAIGPEAAASSRHADAHPSRAFQQASPPADVIPLTPLTGLTSLAATVTITVDGTVNGKPTKGDLTAQLTSNQQGSQIVATGSLLGDIVAQVGGSAVKLFRPKRVSVYQVPEGTYAVVSGLFDVCVKPQDSQATAALQQVSPTALMTTLTSSDVARGTFAGDETLDGTAVKHYVINGEAFMAAAKASTDPNVQLFAQAVTSATDADLYVSADGGYPVAYRGGFTGAFAPLSFEGDLTVDIKLTGINKDSQVVLPGSCDHPISQ
jgi:hypothetical protein